MRADIKMLCVTNWGAVLELVTHPKYYSIEYLYQYCPMREIERVNFYKYVTVADPDAIDAGQTISLDEIKLVARRKR